MFVVERAAESIGMIQRYRIADYQDWARSLSVAAVDATAFGIDYLIGEPDLTGRGIGPAMIDAFVRLSAERYPEAASVAVDVDQLNRRSWRVLEKAGFERVWAGWLHSDDPSDDGPAFVYVRRLENR
jgi:aminoglycoside 6'-N-acetyltransferase